MKPYPILALLFLPVLVYHYPVHATTAIPSQTDDGQDPVNLIFTGYAPASWVAQNLQSWNPTPCSEPKTLDGKTYNLTLETPDTLGQVPPCWGPRYHIRLWDMGFDPVLGRWSIGAVHYEHSECTTLVSCHHVIDSWENAEALVRSTFANGNVALDIGSVRLDNSRNYQGIYNDGNATVVQLSPSRMFSVTFQETGLPPSTPWSINMNGTATSSTTSNITVRTREASYFYKIEDVPGYVPASSNGNLNLTANRIVRIQFTSTRALQLAADQRNMVLLLATSGAAWSVVAAAAIIKTMGTRRKKTATGA